MRLDQAGHERSGSAAVDDVGTIADQKLSIPGDSRDAVSFNEQFSNERIVARTVQNPNPGEEGFRHRGLKSGQSVLEISS
ncbi:MAG TPA: hypothetical protein VG826_19570 [Pirellulales bacterium]|nr:hypothetical protein [Pirellulales bacterium]